MKFIVLLLLLPTAAFAWPDQPKEHWVGLYPSSFHNDLFDDSISDIRSWEIDLYQQSDRTSKHVGTIQIEFSRAPTQGFKAFFQKTASTSPLFMISPHLYDPDWGYGPYFHLTILDRADGLVKVQFSDDIGAVWGDFQKTFGSKNIVFHYLDRGGIFSYSGDSIVIERLNNDSLIVRKEQPADMACGSDHLQFTPYKTYLIHKKDWITPAGRSMFNEIYTRGC